MSALLFWKVDWNSPFSAAIAVAQWLKGEELYYITHVTTYQHGWHFDYTLDGLYITPISLDWILKNKAGECAVVKVEAEYVQPADVRLRKRDYVLRFLGLGGKRLCHDLSAEMLGIDGKFDTPGSLFRKVAKHG